MNLRMNRRTLASSALATSIALPAMATAAQNSQGTPGASPVTTTEMTVGLTSTLEEWTAAAGEGEPVGEMGTMFRYTSPIDGATEVTVGFTEEIATFMEYNYGEEGPGQEDAHSIVASSIPT